MFKKLFIASSLVLMAAFTAMAQGPAEPLNVKEGWFAGAGAGLTFGADGLKGKNPEFKVGLPGLQLFGQLEDRLLPFAVTDHVQAAEGKAQLRHADPAGRPLRNQLQPGLSLRRQDDPRLHAERGQPPQHRELGQP